MLTSQGISEITQAVKNLIDHGQYDIDGQTNIIAPYSVTVQGSKISVYFNFGEGVSGSFSNFKLISTSGNVLAEKADIITKPSEKGLLRRFNIEIKEV
ncbi:hypothetical protein [Ruminiclostridium papyrosolvens]|uniref:Uncharacterized protein n=1 Tax=Ruminiclostridium papyrosolvens C7 TaxID=1330534 RepID=U4QWT4_9FIRM|nr:hypothetical protein [Ruminiclostridium papyrosolvens]EPR07753.1 hypothetical protein L323_19830 [Ruminiclostridium papyrosolvens C7]